MDNSIKELGKIRDSIITGKMTETQLRDAMDKVKKEFGDDVFKPFDLNSIRQYIYSKTYYERLIQLAKNGACSQEFYIHLLRVRNDVKKQSLKKGLVISTVILFFILLSLNLGVSIKNSMMLRNLSKKDSVLCIEKFESDITIPTKDTSLLEDENISQDSTETTVSSNTNEEKKESE